MHSVVFFNHKGGVGKTTLIFNVGLALAATGHRVLFLDADAQANLTALAMAPDEIENAYSDGGAISDVLAPLVDGSGDINTPSPIRIRQNAWIVPGHINLSAYEEICPGGWTEALAGNARGLRVTTAPFRLAQFAASQVDAKYVIFDVGPNVGAMNRNILLACHGFVVPLAPDLFSLNALASVGRRLALWVGEWQAILDAAHRRNLDLEFAMPAGKPAPLGYVSQQFATYRQAPAEAYGRWLEQIPTTYQFEIVERLRAGGLPVPTGPDRIGEIRNLSSLVPIAQRSNAAIWELTGSEARGAQYTRAQDTLEQFERIGVEITRRLAEVAPVDQ